MTTTPTTTQPSRIRASDAEREEIAKIVQKAGSEGRLTLTETEERLAGIYASKFRQELAQYTADLPRAEWQSGRRPSAPGFGELRGQLRGQLRGPLGVHAALVLVLSTLFIVRWVASGVPYFWPAFPIFWLVVSLVVHARIRAGRWRYRGSGPIAGQ
jgi:uncharacterized protein DUF1707